MGKRTKGVRGRGYWSRLIKITFFLQSVNSKINFPPSFTNIHKYYSSGTPFKTLYEPPSKPTDKKTNFKVKTLS